MTYLAFSLLGFPQFIEHRGQEISEIDGFNSNKTRALLAYVAMQQQPVSRSQLATLFWGEMPEGKAATNLRKSLANLRKLAGDHLLITRQTVAVKETAVLDTTTFQTLSSQIDSANHLEKAITLYRDDFLAGLYVKDAREFEAWQLAMREQLRIKAIEILHLLSTQHVPQFTLEKAIGYANQLLQMEPWREATHQQLMILQARNNQHEAVAKQYALCQQVLSDELGVTVSEETTRLYEQITNHQAQFHTSVPAPTTQIIGRGAEIMALETLLLRADVRLVSILATGGMGKTRLATAVAERVAEQRGNGRFWDGVFFVELETLQTAAQIPAHISQTLGFAQSLDLTSNSKQHLTPQQFLFAALKEKQILLILDNVEHLRGAASFISQLMQNCPQVVVLATSREKLRLREEHIFQLQGVQKEDAAQQLFLTFARRLQADFSLTPATTPFVDQICHLLDGMPLALELAATWIDTLSLAAIVGEIEAGLDILTADLHNLPDRHRSVETIFEATWQRLPAKSRQRFGQLTVFQGGFTLAAAKAVTGASVPELAQLVNHALIKLDSKQQRYQIHALLKQFGQAKLAIEETTAVKTRHASFYLHFLAKRLEPLHRAKPNETASQIDADFGNIQAAWQTAVAQANLPLLETASLALAEYAHMRYRLQEVVEPFETAVQAAHNHPPAQARFLAHLARVRVGLTNHNNTELLFEQAKAILQTLDDPHLLAYCLLHWGYMLFLQGESTQTLAKYEKALALCRQTNDWMLETQMMNRMGMVYGRLGDYPRAQTLFSTALTLAEAQHQFIFIVRLKHHLGIIYCLQKEFEKGAAYFHETLKEAQEQQLFHSILSVLSNLGELHLDLIQPKKAETYFHQGLTLAQDKNFIPTIVGCRLGLGRAKQLQGRREEAKIHLQRSLELAQKHQLMTQYAESKLWLAVVAIDDGQTATGVKQLAAILKDPTLENIDREQGHAILKQVKQDFTPAEWVQIINP